MTAKRLLLVKLGGSLVTDKTKPLAPKRETISRLASEIAELKKQEPDLDIIIGNGAGSFGHYTVKKYDLGTVGNLAGSEGKVQEVHQSVEQLNGLIASALKEAGLDTVVLDGQQIIDDEPLPRASIISIYGDIVRDGSKYRVVSTEELFLHLLPRLRKNYSKIDVVFMTSVDGVLDAVGKVISEIGTDGIGAEFFETEGFDVTGGMRQKLESAKKIKKWADSVFIIGGNEPGNLTKLESGQKVGTKIV